MKTEDFKRLEEVYESISNKNKNIISEDANEGLGASLVYLVALGLPFVFDYFSRKYPELKDAFNKIKTDLKNKQTQNEIKNILSTSKQTPQEPSQQDILSSMLTGGVRKPQPKL